MSSIIRYYTGMMHTPYRQRIKSPPPIKNWLVLQGAIGEIAYIVTYVCHRLRSYRDMIHKPQLDILRTWQET